MIPSEVPDAPLHEVRYSGLRRPLQLPATEGPRPVGHPQSARLPHVQHALREPRSMTDPSKRVAIHGLRHGPTLCIDPKCPIRATHPAHPRKAAR